MIYIPSDFEKLNYESIIIRKHSCISFYIKYLKILWILLFLIVINIDISISIWTLLFFRCNRIFYFANFTLFNSICIIILNSLCMICNFYFFLKFWCLKLKALNYIIMTTAKYYNNKNNRNYNNACNKWFLKFWIVYIWCITYLILLLIVVLVLSN